MTVLAITHLALNFLSPSGHQFSLTLHFLGDDSVHMITHLLSVLPVSCPVKVHFLLLIVIKIAVPCLLHEIHDAFFCVSMLCPASTLKISLSNTYLFFSESFMQ